MQDWEDLIYENRNKLYGSYFLRKKHIKYLTIGLLISISLFGLPIGILYINSQRSSVDLGIPLSIPTELSNPAELERLIEPPVEIPDKQEDKITDAPPIVTDSIVKPVKKEIVAEQKQKSIDSIALANKSKEEEGNGKSSDAEKSLVIKPDQMPQFIGGEDELGRFIRQHIVYPPNAVKRKIQGLVIVQLVVSQTGDIKNIKLVSGINTELDQEALRIVGLLPKWIPGKRAGKSVSIRFTIPIVFKL